MSDVHWVDCKCGKKWWTGNTDACRDCGAPDPGLGEDVPVIEQAKPKAKREAPPKGKPKLEVPNFHVDIPGNVKPLSSGSLKPAK